MLEHLEKDLNLDEAGKQPSEQQCGAAASADHCQTMVQNKWQIALDSGNVGSEDESFCALPSLPASIFVQAEYGITAQMRENSKKKQSFHKQNAYDTQQVFAIRQRMLEHLEKDLNLDEAGKQPSEQQCGAGEYQPFCSISNS
nr:hypothetical protein Iba_chr12dCG21290 [Ipomoea batatas]